MYLAWFLNCSINLDLTLSWPGRSIKSNVLPLYECKQIFCITRKKLFNKILKLYSIYHAQLASEYDIKFVSVLLVVWCYLWWTSIPFNERSSTFRFVMLRLVSIYMIAKVTAITMIKLRSYYLKDCSDHCDHLKTTPQRLYQSLQ